MTNIQVQQLDPSFLNDYELMRREFDALERIDSFHGPQMEELIRRFLDKWEDRMQSVAQFPEEVKRTVEHTDLNKCSYSEALHDDLRLFEIESKYRTIDHNDSNYFNNYKQAELSAASSEPHRLLADVYRRACEAAYLRMTYNKSRKNQEDDRREPVQLCQRSIRYDPHSPRALFWYTAALGWYLDVVSNVREQTLAGEVFKRANERLVAMEPRESIGHYLLGIYYYHVGRLNWLERSFVKGFLGVKVEGSHADAEREFKLAIECKREWLSPYLWMAKVMLAQKRPPDEVKEFVELGLQKHANEPSSELDRKTLQELAKKMNVSFVVDSQAEAGQKATEAGVGEGS